MNSPLNLCHYFEKSTGPFRNLSDLTLDEAHAVQNNLHKDEKVFASKRQSNYLEIRRDLEQKARELFILKGGKPKRKVPHYMTFGECHWFNEWYRHTDVIKIPIDKFDLDILSFTYGDLFPTMRFNDQKPYRKKVFTYNEILQIIDTYGLPQEWNKDGKLAPERYIEVQVWDDTILRNLGYIS